MISAGNDSADLLPFRRVILSSARSFTVDDPALESAVASHAVIWLAAGVLPCGIPDYSRSPPPNQP